MAWKKLLLVVGIFVLLLGTPVFLASNPMMDVYQGWIDEDPKTSFHRWLSLRGGDLCYRTMRPERAADFYKRFLDNNPEDGRYPPTWLRYAQSLENCNRNQAATEQYELILDKYDEEGRFSELAAEARRGVLRTRYQKPKN